MPLISLDHVNIRTANLRRSVAWYSDVLGLEEGERPPFSIAGAWMYLGDQPIVHLVAVAAEPENSQPKLEHFALSATGMAAFLARLEAHAVAYTTSMWISRPPKPPDCGTDPGPAA
jgi:catechol 2,3-dioxygenase-like lactoylglutathione lyase family enzyme